MSELSYYNICWATVCNRIPSQSNIHFLYVFRLIEKLCQNFKYNLFWFISTCTEQHLIRDHCRNLFHTLIWSSEWSLSTIVLTVFETMKKKYMERGSNSEEDNGFTDVLDVSDSWLPVCYVRLFCTHFDFALCNKLILGRRANLWKLTPHNTLNSPS